MDIRYLFISWLLIMIYHIYMLSLRSLHTLEYSLATLIFLKQKHFTDDLIPTKKSCTESQSGFRFKSLTAHYIRATFTWFYFTFLPYLVIGNMLDRMICSYLTLYHSVRLNAAVIVKCRIWNYKFRYCSCLKAL